MRVEPKPTIIHEKARGRRWPFSFFRTVKLIIFLLVVGALAAGVFALLKTPKRFNVLVIGSDQRTPEQEGRSDVLMVVSIARSPKDATTVLTIPRDTRVEVPGYGLQKVTHAYALGEQKQGGKDLGDVKLTRTTVENFLHIHLDGSLEVTFNSFEMLIDSLGGITTPTHGKLDGAAALKIVRDRAREGGDFARTADQRELLTELAKKIRVEKKGSQVFAAIQANSESRLELSKLHFAIFGALAYIQHGGTVDLANIHNDVIPGKGTLIYTPEFKKDLYYWVPDADGTKKIVTEWLS